jgi:pilus assembly protein Flp/PilA
MSYEEKGMLQLVSRFAVDESGATAVEYALLVALIILVALAAITAVGLNMARSFNNVSNRL